MEQDITKTGKMSYRDLQKANELDNLTKQREKKARDEANTLAKKEIAQYKALKQAGYIKPKTLNAMYTSNPYREAGIEASQVGLGESQFDENVHQLAQLDDLNEARANYQSSTDKIVNALAKGALLAGTTFLNGTIGLAAGIGQGIYNVNDGNKNTGFLQGIWDNPFTNTMNALTEESEKILPNYYTKYEQEAPWQNNIFTANWLGDKFLKNLGFMAGAFWSGGIYSKALGAGVKGFSNLLRSYKAANSAVEKAQTVGKAFNSVISSGIAAINEGSTEALTNSSEWEKLETMKENDRFKQDLISLRDYYGEDSDEFKEASEELTKDHNARLSQIQLDKATMGNYDLKFNIPILTIGNIIQFGRLFANGFKPSVKGFGIFRNAEGLTTTESVLKGLGKGVRNAASEGTEEISQKAASTISGYYASDDLNNYYKSQIDPNAEQKTLSILDYIGKGISDTVDDNSSWEEFTIGALTGALGMPRFRKMTRADGKKQSPIVLDTGIIGEMMNSYNRKKEAEKLINKIQEFESNPDKQALITSFVQHMYEQDKQDKAALENNKYDFDNSKFRDLFSAAVAYDRAGQLEYLVQQIKDASDLSDQDIEDLINTTTAPVANEEETAELKDLQENKIPELNESINTAVNELNNIEDTNSQEYEESLNNIYKLKDSLVEAENQRDALLNKTSKVISPFTDAHGNRKSNDEIRAYVKKNGDEQLEVINKFIKSKEKIESAYPGIFTDEQIAELSWIDSQTEDWKERRAGIAKKVRPYLPAYIKATRTNIEALKVIRDAAKEAKQDTSDIDKKIKEQKKLLRLGNNLNAKAFLDERYKDVENNDEDVNSSTLVESVDTIKDADISKPLSKEEKEQFDTDLNDYVKIDKGIKNYQIKLSEFLNNPSKLDEAHAKADKEIDNQVQNETAAKILEQINWKASINEIATILDSNNEGINKLGGIKALYKFTPKKYRKRLWNAYNMSDLKNRLSQDIKNSDASDEAKNIALGNLTEISNISKTPEDFINKIGDNSVFKDREPIDTTNPDAVDRIERANAEARELLADRASKLKEHFENTMNPPSDNTDVDKVPTDKNEPSYVPKDKEIKEPKDEDKINGEGIDEDEDIDFDEEDKGVSEEITEEEAKELNGTFISDEEASDSNPTTLTDLQSQAKKSIFISSRTKIGTDNKGYKYDNRPQISEMYLHDAVSLIKHYKDNPNDIPEGADPEAFKKYVKAVNEYLIDKGAYDYISGMNKDKLRIGDEVFFTVDPTLNEDAGTLVVLLATKNKKGETQIIGSMKTDIDWNSKNTRGVLNKEASPINYDLYQAIKEEYNEYEKSLNKQSKAGQEEGNKELSLEEQLKQAREESAKLEEINNEAREILKKKYHIVDKPNIVSEEKAKDESLRGRKQILRYTKELEELSNKIDPNNLKEEDIIKALNLLSRIELNIERGAAITQEEYDDFKKTLEFIKSEGYEIVTHQLDIYNDGMRVKTTMVEDDTLPEGSQVITKIDKPQINKNGKKIQAAEVTVSIGTKSTNDESSEEISKLETQLKEEPYDKAWNDFENLKVNEITIRPDGTINIDSGTSIEGISVIEGTGSKKIVNILFPELNNPDFIKEGETKIIETQGTSRSGKTAKGKYIITKKDGFIKVKHEGPNITYRKLSKQELIDKGITQEDILGDRKGWSTLEDFKKMEEIQKKADLELQLKEETKDVEDKEKRIKELEDSIKKDKELSKTKEGKEKEDLLDNIEENTIELSTLKDSLKLSKEALEDTKKQLDDLKNKKSFDVNNPQDRVNNSKLLNKDRILDTFITTDYGLEVDFKLNSNKLRGVITYDRSRKKWMVSIQKEKEFSYDDLSKEEKNFLDENTSISPERKQEIVNKFIPKELQNYYTSKQVEKDDEELINKVQKPLKNKGIKGKELIDIMNKSSLGSISYLRDNWGIYFFNEWTGENNYLEGNTSEDNKDTSTISLQDQQEKSPFISSIKSEVEKLYYGNAALVKKSKEEKEEQKEKIKRGEPVEKDPTVSEIYGTQTPKLAIVTRKGLIDDKGENPNLLSPNEPIIGQVYLMIPTNTKYYLPVLCTSTPISELLKKPNDEYIMELKNTLNELRASISSTSTTIDRFTKLRGLLGIPGLFALKGNLTNGTFRAQGTKGYKNNKLENNAIRIYRSISEEEASKSENKNNRRKLLFTIYNNNTDNDDIISRILKQFPNLTTNVDRNKLNNEDYRKWISKYIRTNVLKGKTRAVNNWFTYKSVPIEKKKDNKINPPKTPIVPKLTNNGEITPIEYKGGEYTITNNSEVRDSEGNLVSEQLSKEIIAASKHKIPLKEKQKDSDTPKTGNKNDINSILAKAFDSANTYNKNKGKENNKPRRGIIVNNKNLTSKDTKDKVVNVSEKSIINDINKVRQMFPQLSATQHRIIIKSIKSIVNKDGDVVKIYGKYKDRALFINTESPKGTIYHEAFHYVIDAILTSNELTNLFNAAKVRYGNLSNMELEEKMAEDFRKYMLNMTDNSLVGRLKRFFRQIKMAIKLMFNHTNAIDNLFYDAYKNKLSNRPEVSDTFKEDFIKYNNEKMQYSNLDNDTKEYLDLRNISEETYNKMPYKNKEILLHCM